MVLRFNLAAVALLLLATACSSDSKKVTEGSQPVPSPLAVPDIPALITDPQARIEYAALNFWQQLPDSGAIDTDIFEQDLANFAVIASRTPLAVQRTAWAAFFKKRPESLQLLSPILEDYLYNPESPVYSPDLLLSAVNSADSLGVLAPDDRLLALREELHHHSPGTKITDFEYFDRNGARHRLLGAGSQQILLLYDPECDHCAAEIAELSSTLPSTVSVTAIYPGGDFGLWKNHASSLPGHWTVGMNPVRPIATLDEWTIHTLPQLYLLDSDGIVLWRGTSASTLPPPPHNPAIINELALSTTDVSRLAR